jgi:3-oxoacyl-[acyl-carrier protein] reductase
MVDRVALVTGASRGLGAAVARALAKDGWAVAVNYRSDADGARRVVESIAQEGGVAAAFAADVTDDDAVRRLVADVTARLGPVTCVVANAVGNHDPIPVADTTWADCLRQLEFALKSPLLLVQATADGMKDNGGGRVILIGSEAFERGNPGEGAYAAAKGAQLGAARSWASELGPHGITVNVVAPGWIPVERHADVAAADLDAYAARVPLGRMGTPEELAAAVVFLASTGAAFVTGQRLTVNGGIA